MHTIVAVAAVIHFLATYIAVSLGPPGAGEPPLVLGAPAWQSVLGFPLVTIHDALFGPFGPGNFGLPGRSLAVKFWIGGNSCLWVAAVFYGLKGVSRLLRGRH
jgi:hypothetical protein